MSEGYDFPSKEWAEAFCKELNKNEKYGRAAKTWEGDILFVVTDLPEEISSKFGGRKTLAFKLDLWHGECRGMEWYEDPETAEAAYVLEAKFDDWIKIIEGKLGPIPAMTARKLKVKKGSLATIMRYTMAALEMVKTAQQVPIKQ
jgi:putative sterol carrier protein